MCSVDNINIGALIPKQKLDHPLVSTWAQEQLQGVCLQICEAFWDSRQLEADLYPLAQSLLYNEKDF